MAAITNITGTTQDAVTLQVIGADVFGDTEVLLLQQILIAVANA